MIDDTSETKAFADWPELPDGTSGFIFRMQRDLMLLAGEDRITNDISWSFALATAVVDAVLDVAGNGTLLKKAVARSTTNMGQFDERERQWIERCVVSMMEAYFKTTASG